MIPPLPSFVSSVGGRQRVIPGVVDARNHLAQRRAVREALQRVFVTGRRHRQGEVTTRVLVDGQIYDVDKQRLEQLRSGLTPRELFLDPLGEEDS